MAYFAKLGNGNIVETVISINNSVITDSNGIEQEQLGVDYINKLYNTRDVWKQTSYNTKNNKYYNQDGSLGDQLKAFRGNYAGIGYTYNQELNAFIKPKPFNSWVFDEINCNWKSPIEYPNDNENKYYWDENNKTWNKTIELVS